MTRPRGLQIRGDRTARVVAAEHIEVGGSRLDELPESGGERAARPRAMPPIAEGCLAAEEEFCKVLAAIEDPSITDPRERERRFGQFDHVRIYGPDYPQRLAAGGFEVEVLDPSQKWGADVVAASRLPISGKEGPSQSPIPG